MSLVSKTNSITPDYLPFVAELQKIVGIDNVVTDPIKLEPYCTDWRKHYRGQAISVVRPANTDEISRVVKLCALNGVSIVPQGGNTSLCGAATPDNSGRQIVLSLRRLNTIRTIDIENSTITVEAGCILQNVQEAADRINRLFPLSLASEGSCTIGGNLATNAGGTAVLRYGNIRDLCLGLEVVTPNGEIWHGLRALRKDNTGYDLRNLYIGSEGTLGIITAAVLKLFTKPIVQWTALVAVNSFQQAVDLLSLFQERASSLLTGFEVLSKASLDLLSKHFPQFSCPMHDTPIFTVLVEISDFESAEHAQALMENILATAFEEDIAHDAVLASNLSQAEFFWQMREHISEAQTADGGNIKHDISIPISNMGKFVEETSVLLEQFMPGIRLINFGHLGDGNLHFNVAPPLDLRADQFIRDNSNPINSIVYQQVEKFGGSISAEHGIGQLKRDQLLKHRGDVSVSLMQAVKKALDPFNLMNPEKILKN